MMWRVIVMAVLAGVLAIGVALCVSRAADLAERTQKIYTAAGEQGVTQEQQDRAAVLSQEASGLQQLITPLSTGSLTCGLAILLVLGRRWQLREQRVGR